MAAEDLEVLLAVLCCCSGEKSQKYCVDNGQAGCLCVCVRQVLRVSVWLRRVQQGAILGEIPVSLNQISGCTKHNVRF